MFRWFISSVRSLLMTLTTDEQRIQIEEALGHVRQLHGKGAQLAEQFTEAAQRLKQSGRIVPAPLLEELTRWQQARLETLQQVTANRSCSEFVPESLLNADLSEWEQSLLKGIEECRQRAEHEHIARRTKAQRLDNLLDLRSTTEPKYLTALQDRVRQLKLLIDDESQWRTAVDDSDQVVLQAFWELVVDARDGHVDEPESLQRAQQVTERFGLFLTLQAYGGRIVPRTDWPRTLSPEEAISRLQLGQKVEATGPKVEVAPRAASVRSDDFDRGVLEAIGQRCRKRADSASRSNLPLEALCLDTLATGIEYVLEVLKEVPRDAAEWQVRMREGMQSLATCQSALKRVQHNKGIGGEDHEQHAVFNWLNRIAKEQQLFVERHMRTEDVADPLQISDVKRELETQLHDVRKPRRVRKMLQRLDHKLNETLTTEGEDRARWERVIDDIEHLILEEELAASHREIREVLLPHVNDIPEGLPESRSFRQVLAELDRYLADREADEADEYTPQYSDEVQQVANRLRGKRVVMIGGVPRPKTQDKIREAFGLAELNWERTNEHESTQRFQALVQAPDVALVLILIRWVGHGHAEDVKVYCQSVRRLYVFIPRGYGINQLAHDIITQRWQDLATT